MQRSLEIDAGNGEVFTVESSVDGVRSIFPTALAGHSRTHDSEEDAWTWIHQVRARQAAEQDRTERDFNILIETVSKRTFRVKAASFDEATSKYVAGEAVLVSENHSDPSDVQVIDSKSGQWVFYGAADEDGSGGSENGAD